MATTLLISALDGGEWLASRVYSVIPGDTAPSTNCIGCWVCLRASLEAMEKHRNFLSLPEDELRFFCRSAHNLVTTPLELTWLRTYYAYIKDILAAIAQPV
jgi:hypothetical protein